MKNTKKTQQDKVLKDQLARALADYDNLQKRVDKQREEIFKYAAHDVIVKLVPVFDMLDKAQNHLKDKGLSLAIAEFKKILNDQDVVEILPAKGGEFDSHIHEAIHTVPAKDSGKIQEVTRSGWKFRDGRTIRPAQVVVTKSDK